MWSRLSPRARRDISRIIPFGVIWLLMAQVFLVSDYAAAGGWDNVPDSAITVDPAIYLFASLAVTLVGLMVGAVELLFLSRRFRTRSLGVKLIGKTAFYFLLLTAVMLVTFPVAAAMEMGTSLLDARVWERLRAFLISDASLGTSVQMSTSLVLSLFYAEMGEHMGPHVLSSFLTGRYHRPRPERRVFLFSDMKGSTRIAEQLGHDRYFEFLRAYYDSLADAIVDHGGEVYQYVGDEIVVSWREPAGIHDDTCVRCAVAMKQALRAKANWFEARFGVVPDFRAGLQVGPVTTGEIGTLKKEIVFTGDVLNQAARIQALGSDLDEDILLGGALEAALAPTGNTRRSLGTFVLRGKGEAVELFAVDPATETLPAIP